MATNQLSFSINVRNGASTAMNALQKQVGSLKSGLNSLNSGTSSATNYINSLNSGITKSNSVFGSLGRTMKTTIGIFGGFKLINGLINTFTSNMDRAIQRADTMDLFQQKMTMITNSPTTADYALNALKSSTKNTPYALDVAAKGVQNFVLRGMDTQGAVQSVNTWMDAVSAYGNGTNEQFQSVIDALGKMRTKGTVEMRYLNRLFAAGINPVQMYAQATNQTAEDVQTQLSEKTLKTTEFLDTVEKAMREGTNGVIQIDGMAKRMATTWAATLANMRIAIARGLLELVEGLDSFAKFFNENGLKGIVADFGTSTEDVMTKVGSTMQLTAGVLRNGFSQVRSQYSAFFDFTENRIKENEEKTSAHFNSAGVRFKESFFDTISPYFTQIVLKFESLREVWSNVSERFSAGIAQISEPLGRFVGTYLGQTVTGIEDIGIAFGNWLTLKLPSFFDRLEEILNWFIDHKDGVVSAVKAVIKAYLGFGALQTLQNVIVGFNDKLKALNNTLAFFSMGKIQIPTLENLVLNKEQDNTGVNLPKKSSSTNNPLKNSNLIAWITNSLKNTGKIVADKSKNAYGVVKDTTVTAAKGTGSFLKEGGLFLGSGLLGAGKKAQGGLEKFFSNVKGGFEKFSGTKIDDIAKDVAEVSKSTKAAGKSGAKGLGSGVSSFFSTMFSGFSGLKKQDTMPKTDFTPAKNMFSNTAGNFFGTMFGGMKDLGKQSVEIGGLEETATKTGLLSQIMTTLSSTVKGAVSGISSFIATAGGATVAVVAVTAAVGALAAGLGVFNPGNKVSDAINKFFTSFSQWCSTFAQNAPTLIQSFVSGLIQNLPQLVTQGVNLLLSIVNGILTGIPKILTVGVTIVSSLISGLLQVLPELVYQGFNAIGQFISGIVQNLPNILSAAGELIMTLLKGILSNLPVILASGVKLVWSLITGIVSMVGQVGSSILQLIVDGVTYVWQNPGAIWDAMTNLTGELWNALLSGLYAAADMFNMGWLLDRMGAQRPEVSQGGADTAQAAMDGANDQFRNAGIDFTQAINQVKVEQAQADAAVAGQQIGQGVTDGVTAELDNTAVEAQQTGVDTGTNYVDGVTTGVAESAPAVDSALSSVGQEGMAQLQVNFNSEQVAQAANGLIDTLTATINARSLDVAMAMAAMANNAMVQLQASFTYLPEDIPNTIAAAMAGTVEIVREQVTSICALVSTTLIEAKNNADTATQQLAASISTNFNNATITSLASLTALRNGVISEYELLRTQVTEQLGAIESAQTAFSTEGMGAMSNNLMTWFGTIESEYQAFCDDIKGKIDDLKSYHYQAGVDIMSNLKEGLSSKFNEVRNKESEIVQTLKKTFEDGLGIHSPSRWGYWVGQMLIAGMILGIQGSKLSTFVNSTIEDMKNSFSGGKFNADETVNFLTEQGTLDLIGKVSGIDASSMSAQQLTYPLVGTLGEQTSWFGHRDSPGGIGSTNHQGIDLAAAEGTPIAAAVGGNVTTAGWYGGYGNAVVIDAGNGLEFVYGHMSQVLTSVGSNVAKGSQIGLVGSTGNSTGPHLHFEMRQNGTAIDPQPYVGGASVMAGNTLSSVLQMAYNKKYHPERLTALGSISGDVAYDVSAGAAQWAPQVLQALAMLGQPASLLQGILYAIEAESGGNPNAINLSDSNAAAGHPSQGLLQTIPSTFEAYRNPALSNNINDPLANIYAALNYMIQRYGSIENVIGARSGGWYGYAVGTRYVPQDMPAIIHRGEAIIPASQNPYSNSGGDYLADLMANALGNSSLNTLGFDTSRMSTGGTTSNNSTTNNNLNNVFNITNNSDVDGDRNVSEIERTLHNMLQDGRRAGVPR